jgi:hypothetical protein
MNYFFWFLLNLGVPILGPIFVLSLAAVSFGRSIARELIVASVKNGQLYWSAIALSTAAIYDLDVALNHRTEVVDARAAMLPFVILIFFGLVISCAVLVAIASVKAHEFEISMRTSFLHAAPDQTLKTSIGVTIFAVFSCALSHAFFS